MTNIEKLEDIIRDYIGRNKTVVGTKQEELEAPGEHYLSKIVQIEVSVKNQDDDSIEKVPLIAKLVTDTAFMGSTSNLTKNEIVFYKEVVPVIKEFHEKHGIPYPEYFPEFVGGRINLTGDKEPDEDAIILFRDLKEQGYENLDRHVGLNLDEAKLVLADLATFHAVPLAIKLLEPEVFETKIKTNCKSIQLPYPVHNLSDNSSNLPEDTASETPHAPKPPAVMPIFRIMLDIFKSREKWSHVVVAYKNFMEKLKDLMKNHPEKFFNAEPIEPFATLVHTDMWVNNIMQIFKDGNPVKNKILDYQMCNVGSPAQDLIFFLVSSVQMTYLINDFDTCLKYYYEKFANVLKKCDCYGPQFSYDAFLEELKVGAERGIEQCLFMLPNVIFGDKGDVFDPHKLQKMSKESLPRQAKEKLAFLFVEATKKGWI